MAWATQKKIEARRRPEKRRRRTPRSAAPVLYDILKCRRRYSNQRVLELELLRARTDANRAHTASAINARCGCPA